MFQWQIATGKMLNEKLCIGTGYSGHGDGKNNPDMQNVQGVGPIPEGEYKIGHPFDHPRLGPYVMFLTPINDTNTFGRFGFFIHGDAKDPAERGQASDGCIILAPEVRHAIGAAVETGLDCDLTVVSGLNEYGP